MNYNSGTFLSYINPVENTSLLNTSNYEFNVEINPQLLFNLKSSLNDLKKVVTISEIHSERFNLKRPIAIIVSKEDSEFKVEFPSLELYSFGDSEEEAIEEFKNEFLDLCETIMDHDLNALGMHPKTWHRIISSLIK